MQRLTLNLSGPVTLSTGPSEEIAIKSVKARALLAVLATSRGMSARRAQLIDLLWSRGKGRESLRQELRKLRQLAGPDIFIGGTGWIGLNANVLKVATKPQAARWGSGVFAEDLDIIREPEFEDWLRDQRARRDDNPAVATALFKSSPSAVVEHVSRRPLLLLRAPVSAEVHQEMHAEMLLWEAAGRAAPMIGAEVVKATSEVDMPAFSLELSCRASGNYGRFILQPQIYLPGSEQLLWSQFFSTTDELLPEMMADAVASLTVAVVAESDRLRRAGHAPAQRAKRQMPSFSDVFSFDRQRLLRADELLALPAEPTDGLPGASALALRIMIRHTLLIECFTEDADATACEAIEMARHARELAPHDPLVLAMVSLSVGLAGQDDLALETALMAKSADPSHAFARQALSVALSFVGRAVQANDEAIAARSNRMAALAPALFYIRNAKTAIGLGDTHSALRWARLAIQTSPDFRAAHRTVAALAYEAGLEQEALSSLIALQGLEPGFSLDRMMDPSYPIDTLRAAGLTSVSRSGLI